jgi:hypothetical protein
MDSPADGDELARVVPLRRRDRELTATPTARGVLPRERAPFDPEIELLDIPSGHRLPRGTAIRLTRSALRSRRVPPPPDQAPGTRTRRHSPALILTGAGVAGLVTVALLALLSSVLTSSPRSPGTPVESLGGRLSAGAFEPPKPEVLSASANPLRAGGDARVTNKTRAVALRPHRARPDPSRARPTHTRSDTQHPASKGNQSVVVASYTPQTSSASSGNAAPDTPSPVTTTSTPPPASTSTSQTSTSTARATSSSGSATNRPAFGEQGLLGPGSSPDS